MQSGEKVVQNGLAFRHQDRIDFLAEEQNEFMEAGCRVDVRVECIIIVFNILLIEHMAY